MPFTFKLSRRLAYSRAWVSGALRAFLTVGVGALACSEPTATRDSVVQLVTLPQAVALIPGESRQFVAVGLTARGDTVPVVARWSSSGGQVSKDGKYTGSILGDHAVTAAADGGSLISTAQVNVYPPPGAVTDLVATATDAQSVTLAFTEVNDGRDNPAKYDVRYAVAPIAWGSAPSVAQGTCTTPVAGVAIGNRRTCTVLGLSPATGYDFQLVSYRRTLNYNAVFGPLSNVSGTRTADSASYWPVASVQVSPAAVSGDVGIAAQFSATLRDANGQELTGRTVSWSSSNTAVATVNSSGWMSSVAAGSATISASSEGRSGNATVTIANTAALPGQVTDLRVASANDAALVLAFTEVEDGWGQPASYEIRYGSPLISWGSA